MMTASASPSIASASAAMSSGGRSSPASSGERRFLRARRIDHDQAVEPVGERRRLAQPVGERAGGGDRDAGAGIAQDMGVVGCGVGRVGRAPARRGSPSARSPRSPLPAGSRSRSPRDRPARRPPARRLRATLAAWRANSAQSVPSHSPSRWARNSRRSPHSRARANIMAGRFGQCGYLLVPCRSPSLGGFRPDLKSTPRPAGEDEARMDRIVPRELRDRERRHGGGAAVLGSLRPLSRARRARSRGRPAGGRARRRRISPPPMPARSPPPRAPGSPPRSPSTSGSTRCSAGSSPTLSCCSPPIRRMPRAAASTRASTSA